DGQTCWFDHRLTWQIREPSDPTDIPTASTTAWFDAGDLPDRLLLRGPTTGEDLQPFGLDGDRAVADILRDGSVAGSRRWRWPCLVRPSDDPQGDLLWVAGLRQARTAAISETTSRVLEISVERRSAR
ncbi:MAG: tRNA lysidine(34) synthetase TilS C-terminal domain-containing protein, partial [Bradymonadaceae bacterium]